MANVLSIKDIKTNINNYRLRLFIVFTIIMTVYIIISIVFITPTFISIKTELEKVEIDTVLQSDIREANKNNTTILQVRTINAQIKEILKTDSTKSSTDLKNIIKNWDRNLQSIALTSFYFENKDGIINTRISGEAKDRVALNNFVNLLRVDPRFSSISFPVSDLASKEKLEFSLTMFFK